MFIKKALFSKWIGKPHKTEKKFKEKINVKFGIVITFGGRGAQRDSQPAKFLSLISAVITKVFV